MFERQIFTFALKGNTKLKVIPLPHCATYFMLLSFTHPKTFIAFKW